MTSDKALRVAEEINSAALKYGNDSCCGCEFDREKAAAIIQRALDEQQAELAELEEENSQLMEREIALDSKLAEYEQQAVPVRMALERGLACAEVAARHEMGHEADRDLIQDAINGLEARAAGGE